MDDKNDEKKKEEQLQAARAWPDSDRRRDPTAIV